MAAFVADVDVIDGALTLLLLCPRRRCGACRPIGEGSRSVMVSRLELRSKLPLTWNVQLSKL